MSVFASPELDLEPARVAELLADEAAQVIDVRETYERAAGYVEGTRHIELERLASRAPTIARDRPVVFLCRLGARAGMAARAFRAVGYDAYNMRGGITAWAEEGLPLAPPGGRVAEH